MRISRTVLRHARLSARFGAGKTAKMAILLSAGFGSVDPLAVFFGELGFFGFDLFAVGLDEEEVSGAVADELGKDGLVIFAGPGAVAFGGELALFDGVIVLVGEDGVFKLTEVFGGGPFFIASVLTEDAQGGALENDGGEAENAVFFLKPFEVVALATFGIHDFSKFAARAAGSREVDLKTDDIF